jgi:hypothetical protein
MGNIQHIVDVMNSSTVRDLWGTVRGLSHLVKLEKFWGRVAFRDGVPAEIRTTDQPNKYKWKAP